MVLEATLYAKICFFPIMQNTVTKQIEHLCSICTDMILQSSDDRLVSLITLASACSHGHENIGYINGVTAAGLGIAKATCCVAMLRHVVCFSMGLALVTFSI